MPQNDLEADVTEQIPDHPVQEGSRWRYHRPGADEVAAWFRTQPLDEGMAHEDYVSGIVLIPASEKVKKQIPGGTREEWELTFTPYVRVDTRVTYFRNLAALRNWVAVIEPVPVPKTEGDGAYANAHMPEGFWFYVGGDKNNPRRYICCTQRVALYEPSSYYSKQPGSIPLREGRGTKQVEARPDDLNAIAKAETGAIGRALGVAGILVIGTGIATAEDMQELREAPPPAEPALPAAGEPEQTSEAINEELMALQGVLRPHEDQWRAFSALWQERSGAAGWNTINDAPIEVRRGLAEKMKALILEATEKPVPQDSSHAESTA